MGQQPSRPTRHTCEDVLTRLSAGRGRRMSMAGELRKLFPDCAASQVVQERLVRATHLRLFISENKKRHDNLIAAAQLDVDRNFVATRYAIGRWEVDGLYRDYKREVALANELEDQESRDFIIIAAVFNFQSAMHHLVFREHRSSLRDFESFVHDVIARLDAARAAPEEPPARYKSWADYYNALEEKVLWDLELAKGPRPPPPPPYIPSPPGVTPPPPPLLPKA